MITIQSGKMIIPENERFVGFAGDNLTRTKVFLVPDAADSDSDYILYLRFDNDAVTSAVLDKSADGDDLVLTWNVRSEHLLRSGVILAQIKITDGDVTVAHTGCDYFIAAPGSELGDDGGELDMISRTEFERRMGEAVALARATAPYIGDDGYWYVYSPEEGDYVRSWSAGGSAVDSEISATSTNPVQNKVVKAYVDAAAANIPTAVSQLTNDSGYLTAHQDITGKMNLLQRIGSSSDLSTVGNGQLFACQGVFGVRDSSQPGGYTQLITPSYISTKEETTNKVTSLSSSSTDTEYPSAKCVYDALDLKANASSVPTKTSDLINDSGFVTGRAVDRNVNFVGMSIWWYDGSTLDSNGFCGGEIARGYQTLLKEQFAFRSTVNYCYSGYSLGATAASDAYSIMESAAANWTGSAGDIWTLDTITNDFKRNIPIGSISDYTNATGNTTYYGALRAFKDRVSTLSGVTAVVICSNALRRNNDGYTSVSQNTAGHTLTDYEYALMNVAARNNWYFVDQFRLSGITDDSIMLTTLDGLHLNNFGYSLAVKPWIEQFNILANKLNNAENLIVNIITGGYVNNTDGTTVAGSNWNRTDYVKVTPGKAYRYYGSVPISATTTAAVYGYDANKAAVAQIVAYNVDSENGLYFTVPSNVEYIRCCSVKASTLDVKTAESAGCVRMIGDVSNRYLKSDGSSAASSGWRVIGQTSAICVNVGETYKYVGTTSAGSGAGVVSVCGYDSSLSFVSVLVSNGDHSTGTTFTIPSGVSYIKCCSQSTLPPEIYRLI